MLWGQPDKINIEEGEKLNSGYLYLYAADDNDVFLTYFGKNI